MAKTDDVNGIDEDLSSEEKKDSIETDIIAKVDSTPIEEELASERCRMEKLKSVKGSGGLSASLFSHETPTCTPQKRKDDE